MRDRCIAEEEEEREEGMMSWQREERSDSPSSVAEKDSTRMILKERLDSLREK